MPTLHNMIIGGVTIGFNAAHQINQTYETLGGRSLRRMMSGAGQLQTHWSKLRTVISGAGRAPEGLDSLDYSTALTLSCMAPRSAWSATTAVTIPASTAYRSDWAPHGYALVNGIMVPTAISIAGTTATCSAVSGASGYVVAWYPVLSCFFSPPSRTFNGRGGNTGWKLVGEEA